MQRFTLMRMDTPILDASFDEESMLFSSVGKLHNLEAAPLAVYNERLKHVRDLNLANTVNRWWLQRCIPSSRSGLQAALRLLGAEGPSSLAVKVLGLSLSDQYWLRPEGFDLSWGEVNFFDNDFDDAVGEILAGGEKAAGADISRSPSSTTAGVLMKKWVIDSEGTRSLLKGGTGVLQQEPFNEVIASMLCGRILDGDEYVPYSLLETSKGFQSSCPCFVDGTHSLVAARDVLNSFLVTEPMSYKEKLVEAGERLGLGGGERYIDKLIVVDYILGNEDRHDANFGAILDSQTGRFQKWAPVYDSGLSLLCSCGAGMIDTAAINSQPFSNRHFHQLAQVENLDWVDFGKLEGFADDAQGVLSRSDNYYLDDARIEYIGRFIQANIDTLKECHSLVQNENLALHEKGILIEEKRQRNLSRLGGEVSFDPRAQGRSLNDCARNAARRAGNRKAYSGPGGKTIGLKK